MEAWRAVVTGGTDPKDYLRAFRERLADTLAALAGR